MLDHLSKITQITNVNIDKEVKCVTWKGRTTGIQRGIYYPFEYQYLLDHHQYSVLLSDASFFQFYYYFDDTNKLKEARLAYYPRPIHIVESKDDLNEAIDEALNREDDDLYEHLYNWIDLLDLTSKWPANTSHIRFDFDAKTESHDPSHLQFGGVQDFRIPADFVPQPLAFLQLCQSLITDCAELKENHLNFARNHSFCLNKTKHIISINNLK